MDFIDVKYINLISSRLPKFKKVKANLFQTLQEGMSINFDDLVCGMYEKAGGKFCREDVRLNFH